MSDGETLTEVRAFSLLLQPLVHALNTEVELGNSRFYEAAGNEKQQHLRQRRGETTSGAEVGTGLEDVEDGMKPPMPLRIPKTVERFTESQITNDVEGGEVVP